MLSLFSFFFFFNDTATTEIYTLSLHALFRSGSCGPVAKRFTPTADGVYLVDFVWAGMRKCGLRVVDIRSEEHTSELQSQSNLVCRLLLEKKKKLVNATTIVY